jgi:hypothetical protein
MFAGLLHALPDQLQSTVVSLLFPNHLRALHMSDRKSRSLVNNTVTSITIKSVSKNDESPRALSTTARTVSVRLSPGQAEDAAHAKHGFGTSDATSWWYPGRFETRDHRHIRR